MKRGLRPFRYGQIISAILLNAYVLAYIQNKVIYTGFLKSVPEPVLNCYGGPLSVFACPMGSLQQIIGIHQVPWFIIGAFLLVGIVVGRMACAWVCPFGLWQDLLEKIPVGARAGKKRWISLAAIAGVTALIAVALIVFVKVSWWPVLLFGWLPFMIVVLLVVLRGKLDIPDKMWLGGFLSGIAVGLLFWFRFGASFGVVAGVFAMVLFSLTGRWFAALAGGATWIAVFVLGSSGASGSLQWPAVVLLGAIVLAPLILDMMAKKTLPSTFLKFSFLLVIAVVVAYKTGEPWFCKLCPQGTLEAGIPLVVWDPMHGLRQLVGWLYWVKIGILLSVVAAAIAIKRPFCRLICPIGAVYSVFNKFSLLHLEVDKTCKTCQLCVKVCPMDIEVHRNANQLECIRCLECKYACTPKSVQVKF